MAGVKIEIPSRNTKHSAPKHWFCHAFYNLGTGVFDEEIIQAGGREREIWK